MYTLMNMYSNKDIYLFLNKYTLKNILLSNIHLKYITKLKYTTKIILKYITK